MKEVQMPDIAYLVLGLYIGFFIGFFTAGIFKKEFDED